MPGMLLAGILLGLATPTEIAALAVVYGVTLAMFVYREMTVAGFLRAVQDTAALTGVLLEGLPSLNVLAPLLLPIAVKLGFSGLHFAIVLIIAMGVGGFMPLAGVGFYVCCAVMRCEIEPASRAMLPYLAVVLAGLLIVAFVPRIALASPNHFGFHG